MTDAVNDILMQVPLFADLDPPEIQLLADSMRKRTFRMGDVVTAEGAAADGFFVVESGDAEVLVHGEPRGTIKRGDCFGETALLMGSERTATIRAISDLRCYALAPSEFCVIVEGNPLLAWKLYQSMARWLS